MKQYIKATYTFEGDQVITSMYLLGDTNLWWKTRLEEDVVAECSLILVWEIIKHELQYQFFPFKVVWQARKVLQQLKQTDIIQDYIKVFTGHLRLKIYQKTTNYSILWPNYIIRPKPSCVDRKSRTCNLLLLQPKNLFTITELQLVSPISLKTSRQRRKSWTIMIQRKNMTKAKSYSVQRIAYSLGALSAKDPIELRISPNRRI